jgi:hypothetical protein
MATKPPVLTDSFDEASQVPQGSVGPDRPEGFLGAMAEPGGSLDKALQAHHQQRVAHAQMYRTNAATAIGQIAKGTKWDPTLNGGVGGERPLTQQEQDDLTAQKDEALQQYGKIIGVNKESKGALDKAHGIIDFILRRKQEQQGRPGGMQVPPTPQYGSTVGEGGVTMTPPTGSTPTVMDNGVTMTPPPPVRPQPSALEQSVAAPFAQHQAQVGQGLTDQQRVYQAQINRWTNEAKQIFGNLDSMAAKRYALTGTFGPASHLQAKNLVDPDTGEPVVFDPLEGTYSTQDGRKVDQPVPFQKPTMVEVVMPNGDHAIGYEAYKKLTDQSGKPLPEGTKKYYPSAADTTTTTKTWKTVQQPDGSTALVPVTNVSERRKGGTPAPPTPVSTPSMQPSGTTVSKPAFGPQSKKSSSPQSNAATAMGLPPGARIVGGKVPPGVAKAYDAYNGSVTRYKVMQEALPKALKGDQQAMINLLYNHIGMTTGLQKGGRITQPIIDEAQNSAPWMATLLKRVGIGNEFEMTPDLLRGVVIDPQTMHNMIGLAEDRVNNEYAAWQREIGSAKTGYGMSTSPPPSSPDMGTATKSGSKASSFKPF